ncbi:MAG: YfcC family protein [Opitutales bacterium]
MHPTPAQRRPWSLDPVMMMVGALVVAIALTWLIPSGRFERTAGGLVRPGTYQIVPKEHSPAALLPSAQDHRQVYPASPAAIVTAIPAGMERAAGLIFMIIALGGMFGVLRATGTVEAAMEHLVNLTGARLGVLTAVLMVAISAGGSFLGLISQYLVIIPLFMALSKRLGLEPMFGFALVTVAAKIGYLASVANPVVLVVAQPIAGVPVFSGLLFRLVLWVVMLALGIGYVLRLTRVVAAPAASGDGAPLSGRQISIIAVLGAAVVLLIYGAAQWHWTEAEFSAVYLALSAAIAVLGRIAPGRAAHHLVDGMKSMMLAGLLVGMAKAVEIILLEGQILDTIVHALAAAAQGLPPVLVGLALVFIEIVLGLLIPSGSAKAALSMPILVPIGQMAGVSGQATVLAYLMGNGLVNMVAPTSGMLLAYLATADISFGRWFRFVLPLMVVLLVVALAAVALAVLVGY